ncbi:unnamed protein product [Rotaria sp. Silwood2]|nr:unnamed protein product [Rotaria sp. Silwood2]
MVSEKLLHIVADNFYLSHDNKLRESSYHLLDMANDNQDISEGIFNIFELEKASHAIRSYYLEAKCAIVYLLEKTKNGHRLTINGFRALAQVINTPWIIDNDVLKILLNVSNNGQIIPIDLVGKLTRRFNPCSEQYDFVRIFENLVKNNQDIPSQLSSKLTKALENPSIRDQIIDKILDKFFSIKNSFIMEQYLSVMCSVIEKKDYFATDRKSLLDRILRRNSGKKIIARIQTALVHALKTDNQDVIRKAINGLKILVSRHKAVLENNSIDILLNQNDKFRIFHCDILVCIALTLEAKKISELKSLEINIFNDDEIIRYWSFRGLRAAYDRGFRSSTFLQWCDDIINKLEDNTDVEVNFDLDLFETIAALKYIDFDKIDGKPQNRWNRELLICDLIERFYITEAERFQFYEAWLDIEEHRKSQSDILLKLLHRFLVNNNNAPFTECYETVKILDQIDFDTAHDILLHSSQAFVDLRQAYLTVIIHQCLLNRAGISGKYIEALASNMMSTFGFDLSQKVLSSLQSISNLPELENILNFSKTYHIKLSDIYVKNASVPILKRSLQIKLLGNQIEKADRLKLGVCLDDLLDKNWAFEQLNHFFSIMKQSNSREKERYFLCVLEIISHYKIPSKEENYEKYQQF